MFVDVTKCYHNITVLQTMRFYKKNLICQFLGARNEPFFRPNKSIVISYKPQLETRQHYEQIANGNCGMQCWMGMGTQQCRLQDHPAILIQRQTLLHASDYYRQQSTGRIPVKRMAPEISNDRISNETTDVVS